MLSKIFALAVAAAPLIAAHGTPTVLTSELGGNGTSLGNMGGVVPKTGSNDRTEKDTTQFSNNGNINIRKTGLGQTTAHGRNKVNMVQGVMALSGPDLPKISTTDATKVNLVWHVITTDGYGPITGCLDTTGTGDFRNCTVVQPDVQVPGKNGNGPPGPAKNNKNPRNVVMRSLERIGLIQKRATNVNKDYQSAFTIPASTCTGTTKLQSGEEVKGLCLFKISNNSKAGPFGGTVPIINGQAGGVQVAAPSVTAGSGAAEPSATAATAAEGKTNKGNKKNNKNQKRRIQFQA